MAAILVTDDDPDTRVVVAEVLKRNGYNLLAAEGSAEGPQYHREPKSTDCLFY